MSKARVGVVICCLLVVTGVACLIAGLVFLDKSKSKSACDVDKGTKQSACEYSTEALRSGLPDFLQKVQTTYYDLHPYMLRSDRSAKEFREKFMPYDPSPVKLKQVTDKSLELLRELQSKKIVKYKLKPRERKAVAQMAHYLQHSFGTPFAGNYYGGDFLLGPDKFCWQAMCQVNTRNYGGLLKHKPTTIEDVQVLLSKIKAVNHTFAQYKANLMYGVKAGMVRSTNPCKVGADALIKALKGESVQQGPQGILLTRYGNVTSDEYLANLSDEAKKQWQDKNKKTVKEYIRVHVIDYIGKPLNDLITYLQTIYLEHCVPSEVSSGLANLPLAHVYVNGSRTNQSTHPYLPDGTRLNGSKAYEYLLSYFSTTNITPNEVQTLGYHMIDKLYYKILGLAREYTNQTNNDTAKEIFQKKLNSSVMYYDLYIPDIESNATAYDRCTTDERAKEYCPVRWKIIQMMFADVNKIMSILDGQTVDMFYFTGSKHTTPNCPVSLRPNYDANMGVPSYSRSTHLCTSSAWYNIPFFLSRPGPKFNQWSVNSHEARPGHHTQVQGHVEHFRDSCGGVIGWLGIQTRFTAFVEGWGLYAENPLIGQDTKVYDNRPTDKYGMIRGQLWRALRLVADTGLHFTGFSRQKAYDYFKDYAWIDNDVLRNEITRYQSNPGQATSYMIGHQHIIKLRARAQKELGEKFKLKDFHYHLLKDGSAPLSYLTESIDDYIRCIKDTKDDGCEDILSVEGSGSSSNKAMDMDIDLLPKHVTESYY